MKLSSQPQTQVFKYSIPSGLKLYKVFGDSCFYSPRMTTKLPSLRDVSTLDILQSSVTHRRIHHQKLYKYSSNLILHKDRFHNSISNIPMIRLKGFKRVIVDLYTAYDTNAERFIYKILKNIHFQEFFSVKDVCCLNFSLFKQLLASCRIMKVVMNAVDFKSRYLKLLMEERYVTKKIYLVLNETCKITNIKIKEEEGDSDSVCDEEEEKFHLQVNSKDVINMVMQLQKWDNIHVTLYVEVLANIAMISEMSAEMWNTIFLPQIQDLVMSFPSFEFLFINLSYHNISNVINLILESLSAPPFEVSSGRKWKNGNIFGLRSSFDFRDDGINLKNSYRKKKHIKKIIKDFQKIKHNKFHLRKNFYYIFYCGFDADLKFVYTSAYPQNAECKTELFTKVIYC